MCTVLNAQQEMNRLAAAASFTCCLFFLFVRRFQLTHVPNSCIVFEYETGPAGAAFPLEAEANIALEVPFV